MDGTPSFWGWGFEERFPDAAALRSLSERVSAGLGMSAPVARPPPRLSEVALPEPRIGVPAELAGFCAADRGERVRHTYGKSYRDQVRGFSGDFRGAPDLVASWSGPPARASRSSRSAAARR
jgi:alkyldihydroxyacetonephosphate synthase